MVALLWGTVDLEQRYGEGSEVVRILYESGNRGGTRVARVELGKRASGKMTSTGA